MERSGEIQSLTKFNTEDFDFTGTFHDLVGNRGFGEGYNRPGEPDSHYIWEVLSAIGEGIGTALYSNVLHYTDLVANVDTCKVKQLQSFLNLFGMNMTVYDEDNPFPVEIQNLVDTLSIQKKYLFRSQLVTDELKGQIEKYRNNGQGVLEHTDGNSERDKSKWFYKNIPNSFSISRTSSSIQSSPDTDSDLIYGEYSLTYDDGYSIDDVVENGKSVSSTTILRRYQNDGGFSILKACDPLGGEHYLLSSGTRFIGQIDDAQNFENQVNVEFPCAVFSLKDVNTLSGFEHDDEFIRQNLGNQISVSYITSQKLSVDDVTYSEEQYRNFVRDIFLSTLLHFINLPYNTRINSDEEVLSSKPIYSYSNFWESYHNSDDKYEYLNDDSISDQKKAYNIESSFDEQGIVDNIEQGNDQLDNYSNNEQVILSAEMERRKAALNFSDLGIDVTNVVQDSDSKSTSYEPYTRYSYYRYRKVKEYVDFVENHLFANDNQLSSEEYSYDRNYIIKNGTETVNILTKDGEDGVRLQTEYVEKTAEQLANVVQYICKLRETLKIQVRKNYIKGTSNLLRYVVNEYVREFGKNSEHLKHPSLREVYDSLVNHDIDDVEVIEYVDTTEYFNIETENTEKSLTKNVYNTDYFTDYFKYDKNSERVVQTKEPYELDIGEIRSFYISTLALQDILDTDDELNDYLSVIYNVGKSKRYIDPELSIMVCELADGRNSRDMYLKNTFAAKCLEQTMEYLEGSEYEFKQQLLSSQVEDILSLVIYPGLSDTYLSDYQEVYDRYIGKVTEQHDAMENLRDSVNKMLSGDLNYYYAKSSIKYCYEDNDTYSGTYKHDYLYDNPDYETPYLLGLIQNIEAYSTEANIRNHPIFDSIDYFRPQYETMYNDYTGTIRPYLNTLGYVETNSSPTFGDMVTAAKTFASNKKDQLTNEAQTRWTQFSTTANSLKSLLNTQSSNLNTIVGKLDLDELETGEVYCFTDTKVKRDIDEVDWDIELGEPTHYAKRTKKALKKGKTYEFQKTVEIDGVSYKYYREVDHKDEGDDSYPYWIQSVGTYDSSDVLAGRIETIKGYFSCWKFFRFSYAKDEDTGQWTASTIDTTVEKVGSTAEIESIEREVNSIQSQYDTLVEQMQGLGCDYDDSSTGIEDQIDALIAYINANSSTKITSGDVQRLVEIMQTLDQYSSEYTTMGNDFISLTSDADIATYLNGSNIKGVITTDNLANLEQYSEKKDRENLETIQLSIDNFMTEYDKLKNNIHELIYQVRTDIKTTSVADDYVENQLSSLKLVLENDRDTKFAERMEVVTREKDEANYNFEQMDYVLSDYGDSTNPLSSVLQEIVSDNDIDTNEEYQKALHEFRSYSNTDEAYQRYYNRKNVTHATRQVHPFMWNFIKYVEDTNNTDKVFYSYRVSELESAKVEQTIDKILGQNGNLRDIWKYSIQDFSGYTTRYIANNNTTRNNTQIFEVAEYDGAFYPPAIDQYRNAPDKCINSLSGRTTLRTICNRLNRVGQMPTQLSDCLSACSIGTMGDYLYAKLSGNFDPYVYDCNLQSVLDDFMKQIDVITISDDITGEERITTSTKRQDLLDYLSENLNKTFYERFYQSLELKDDNIDFIVEQLQNQDIRKRIYEITDDQSKADVFDIYDYALDSRNNIYILYKNYGNAHPTYKQKKNTLGQVWVRLENHPIAFPLVSEARECQRLSQIKFNDETNKYLHEIIYDQDITRNYCYHLEFSQNRTILALACKKTSNEMEKEVDPIFDKYEYATIVMSEVGTENDDARNFKRLTLTNNNGEFDDIITGTNKKRGFNLPLTEGEESRICSFLGMYSPAGSRMNLVYVEKTYQNVGNDRVKVNIGGKYPTIKIQKFDTSIQGLDNGNSTISFVKTGNSAEQTISDIVFSYNKTENRLTFCFIRGMGGDYRKQEVFGRDVNMVTGTEGAIFKDKFTKTMNSFDVFIQNVCTMVTTSPGKTMKELSYTESNINADMSFIPIYPDREYSSVIENDMKEYGCYNIELLGRERNIDAYIGNTNPNPDPYFDADDINENEKFGRVYEDYLDEHDRTFMTVENDSLNSNMTEFCQFGLDQKISGYRWTFDLQNIEDSAIDDFKILIFNKNTLGKNPYYLGDLTALIDERAADYKSEMNSNGSNERKYNDDTLKEGCEFVVAGINPANGTTSGIDKNTIYNISNIKFRFDRDNRQITTSFIKDNKDIDSSVNRGTVRYVLFNTHDITVFEYYHLFDQYGLINVRYGNVERVFSGSGDYGGYRFVYDTSKYSRERLEDAARAYYYDSMRRRDLGELHLSDYDCLSDVYVFQGHNRLQFKYSDQDVFHISALNYYFPTLNTKYPYTTGQLVAEHAGTIGGTSDDKESIYEIFDDSNVYIIGFEENKDILKDVGSVDIPRMYNPNDFVLGFEDYLDTPADLRSDYYNAKSLHYLVFGLSSESEQEKLPGGVDLLSDLGVEIENKTTDEVLEELSKSANGLFAISAEASHVGKDTRYDRVNLSETDLDGNQKISIAGLTELYVNYKRDEDLNGITLYFNYNNYLNSPFVKMNGDGDVLIDTIDSTYLKLKSGESGYLDTIIQVKHREDGILLGYTNVTLARYQIFNISDDKPKFVVRVVNKVQRDEYKQDDSLTKTCDVGVGDILLSQNQLIPYEKDKYQTDIVVRFDSDDSALKSVDFYLFFPSQIFNFDTTRSPQKCNVAYVGDGCVHVTSDLSPNRIAVPIITVSPAFDLLINNTDTYELFVYKVNCYDGDGNGLFANTSSGIFMVVDAGSDVNTVLVNENGREGSPTGEVQNLNVTEIQIITETGRKPILTRRFT